ncbi:hypothetical protein INR49_016449 [Caranx melampygus]|nr:hypothetical protein INR49_016449 [Caranx melampygus]
MVDTNCGCVKTELQSSEPDKNGHVNRHPGDLCSIFSLNSTPPLIDPTYVPDSGQRVLDLPRIVKHKLTSITFSDDVCATGANGHTFANKSSDDGGSMPEEEEEDDDDEDDDNNDVFPELSQSREFFINHRHRSNGKGKQKRRSDRTGSNNGYEAEEETSSKEESPQVTSPWSESMSHLMRKLDRLNLDIEEALSASSSPSDTPCTARKKQWGAVSKCTSNQTPNNQDLERPDGRECLSQDRSSAPRCASVGTRARTKKTMFNKMTNAAGAGKEIFHLTLLFLCFLPSSLMQCGCIVLSEVHTII